MFFFSTIIYIERCKTILGLFGLVWKQKPVFFYSDSIHYNIYLLPITNLRFFSRCWGLDVQLIWRLCSLENFIRQENVVFVYVLIVKKENKLWYWQQQLTLKILIKNTNHPSKSCGLLPQYTTWFFVLTRYNHGSTCKEYLG